MSGLLHDVRGACRHLARRPLHVAGWSGTLALTLGAAAAVFGLVDALLLRPLPYPEEGRLVRIHTAFPESGLTELSLSPGEFVDVQERAEALEAVGGYIPDSYTLTRGGEVVRVRGAWATPGFFRTLGMAAARGRTFSSEERGPDAPRLAVLSHGFWRRQLGSDPDVVGSTISLDGRSVTVVGVMPGEFRYPEGAELWTSLRFTEGMLAPGERGSRYLRVVGRVRSSIDAGALQRRLEALVPGFRREHPQFYRETGFRLTVVGVREHLVGDVRPALLALLGGAALVLLIAVANLTNLSLVHTVERHPEMAVRASLGASRRRLVRQVMLENLAMAAAGGAVGVVLATWGAELLAGLAPEGLPRLETAGAEPRILVVGLVLALAAGLLTGLVPAVLAVGRGLGAALGPGRRRGGERPRGRRTRDLLVGAQVAVTLTLLVGAGLVVRSLDRLRDADPGLDPSATLTARLGLPSSAYGDDEEVRLFYHELLAQMRQLPGVRSAGATAILPLDDGGWEISFEVAGRPRPEDAPDPAVQYRPVTPGFLETLRVPIVRGRPLTESDRSDAPLVAVVNRAFARQFLSGQDAVGARIRLPLLGIAREEHVRAVVGVVGDVRESLTEEAPPTLYVPHAQQPERAMTLVLRGDVPPRELTGAVRTRLARLDPALPLYEVRSMAQVVSGRLARHRFISFLLGLFSATGLVLACIGVWGVVAYAVARRSHEVGIRMALGATPREMVTSVVGRGLLPVVAGAGIGLAAALLATGLLRGLLFGLGPRDPWTFAVATSLIVVVGALAAWLPARRASAVDPAETLRSQ